MNKITLLDIKQAMRNSKFRNSLPPEINDDIQKYLKNPGCQTCNAPIYTRIIKECRKQIQEFFPGKEIISPEDEIKEASHWQVINCSIIELEGRLKKLNPLHKQIAMARWQDQITVIIHEQ